MQTLTYSPGVPPSLNNDGNQSPSVWQSSCPPVRLSVCPSVHLSVSRWASVNVICWKMKCKRRPTYPPYTANVNIVCASSGSPEWKCEKIKIKIEESAPIFICIIHEPNEPLTISLATTHKFQPINDHGQVQIKRKFQRTSNSWSDCCGREPSLE